MFHSLPVARQVLEARDLEGHAPATIEEIFLRLFAEANMTIFVQNDMRSLAGVLLEHALRLLNIVDAPQLDALAPRGANRRFFADRLRSLQSGGNMRYGRQLIDNALDTFNRIVLAQHKLGPEVDIAAEAVGASLLLIDAAVALISSVENIHEPSREDVLRHLACHLKVIDMVPSARTH